MWNRIRILAFTLLLQFMAPKDVSHFRSNGSYSCHSKPRSFLQQPHTLKKINVSQESKKMRSPFQNESAFINKYRQIHMVWISCSSYQERSPKLACLGISPEWKVFCFCSWWNQFCHPQHQHSARALSPRAAVSQVFTLIIQMNGEWNTGSPLHPFHHTATKMQLYHGMSQAITSNQTTSLLPSIKENKLCLVSFAEVLFWSWKITSTQKKSTETH